MLNSFTAFLDRVGSAKNKDTVNMAQVRLIFFLKNTITAAIKKATPNKTKEKIFNLRCQIDKTYNTRGCGCGFPT